MGSGLVSAAIPATHATRPGSIVAAGTDAQEMSVWEREAGLTLAAGTDASGQSGPVAFLSEVLCVTSVLFMATLSGASGASGASGTPSFPKKYKFIHTFDC